MLELSIKNPTPPQKQVVSRLQNSILQFTLLKSVLCMKITIKLKCPNAGVHLGTVVLRGQTYCKLKKHQATEKCCKSKKTQWKLNKMQ